MVENKLEYFVVESWMNKLGLNTTQRDIYAVIYGFCRDGKSDYHGTAEYMSRLIGVTVPNIYKNLSILVDKGLIEKKEFANHGMIKIYTYAIIAHNDTLYCDNETLCDEYNETLYRYNSIDNINDNNINKLSSEEDKTIYSREEENKSQLVETPAEDDYEKHKHSKDIKQLMRFTNIWIKNESVKSALISWLNNMMANNKWQTLEVYRNRIDKLYSDCKGNESLMVDVINEASNCGYVVFDWALSNISRNNKVTKQELVEKPKTKKLTLAEMRKMSGMDGVRYNKDKVQQ